MKVITLIILLASVAAVASGFSVASQSAFSRGRKAPLVANSGLASSALFAKLSDKRRKELGVADDEDEYDLGKALDTNTDPLITKIIAGSLILVIIGLLVAGVIIPSTTDYGEGVCNPILTAGRC